uniref:Putative secreted protein n=1 Tax=Ixodes ricinus TaxID=34613 RepID=A0A147BLQ2_IXORI
MARCLMVCKLKTLPCLFPLLNSVHGVYQNSFANFLTFSAFPSLFYKYFLKRRHAKEDAAIFSCLGLERKN